MAGPAAVSLRRDARDAVSGMLTHPEATRPHSAYHEPGQETVGSEGQRGAEQRGAVQPGFGCHVPLHAEAGTLPVAAPCAETRPCSPVPPGGSHVPLHAGVCAGTEPGPLLIPDGSHVPGHDTGRTAAEQQGVPPAPDGRHVPLHAPTRQVATAPSGLHVPLHAATDLAPGHDAGVPAAHEQGAAGESMRPTVHQTMAPTAGERAAELAPGVASSTHVTGIRRPAPVHPRGQAVGRRRLDGCAGWAAGYGTHTTLGTLTAGDRWSVCLAHLLAAGGRSSRGGLADALTQRGCNPAVVDDVIDCWLESTALLETSTGITRGPLSEQTEAGMCPQGRTLNTGIDRGAVAILSLFDGTGMARVAIEQIINRLPGYRLVAAAFVEHNADLSTAVARAWAQLQRENYTAVPYQYLATDVWDLLRRRPHAPQAPPPVVEFAERLPRGTTVIIPAGSPCQQLTYGGRHAGRQGLCGPQSVHFFAVPVTAWMLQQCRPDLFVHVVLENAASMTERHRGVILQALGGLTVSDHLRTLDSLQWCPFPRRRHFFSTMRDSGELPMPAQRPAPWEPGWAPHPQGTLGPMMCSRSRQGVRASTPQYHVKALVYRRAQGPLEIDWHAMSLEQLVVAVQRAIPQHLRGQYTRLLRGGLSGQEERDIGPVMDWIGQQGDTHGFRIPTVEERARATGCESYLVRLQLSPLQMFDATGNHFDPEALRCRIERPLRAVLADGPRHRHTFVDPADLAVMYRGLARQVEQEGIPVQRSPFPDDLHRALTVTWAAPSGRHGGRPEAPGESGQRDASGCGNHRHSVAAEHGRGAT